MISQFAIYRLNGALITKAQAELPAEYRQELRNKPNYHQSLAARYALNVLADEMGIEDFLPEHDKNGIPRKTDGYYWSVSHKKHVVAVALSDEPIGIDIEIPIRRSGIMFDEFDDCEWQVLGEMNWLNFYRLWTAKEALAKKGFAMPEMQLVETSGDELKIQWQHRDYLVESKPHHEFYFAIA